MILSDDISDYDCTDDIIRWRLCGEGDCESTEETMSDDYYLNQMDATDECFH
jgi:hypothetical protein